LRGVRISRDASGGQGADTGGVTNPRATLSADCSHCAGLCCVALAFARSSDFAFDKAAGEPCEHLEVDFRCEIHAELRPQGFKGCTVFDCFGAGQRVTAAQISGHNWRDDSQTAASMFAGFPIVRQLHELLWYLTEAADLASDHFLRQRITDTYAEIDSAAGRDSKALLEVDLVAFHAEVGALLTQISESARAPELTARTTTTPRAVRPGADLAGASLAEQDLRGLSLRGAVLIAADLSGADLRRVDLLGADLRDAKLAATDLSSALFVTQSQLEAAQGNSLTRIPDALRRPSHWAPAD
jgi:uncharacterized protein YjbI with pentapeptide repeats